MARLLFTLFALLGVFQGLAAPLTRRAVLSPECNGFQLTILTNLLSAQDSLGPINTANDVANARNILLAQLSLLDANNGSTQIADATLNPSQPPAPADAEARIVAGLQAAQQALNGVFSFENATTAAVQAANSSITLALDAAQQGLAINCTTTVPSSRR